MAPNVTRSAGLSFYLIWFIFLACLARTAHYFHHWLPTPNSASHDANGPLFRESRAREITEHLAKTYRVVGMKQFVDSENYVLAELEALQKKHANSDLHTFEVSHQKADHGGHLFDFIGKPVHKEYSGLTNVVFRISSKRNPASKDNAILFNAHLDSTFAGPGAVDDAAPCAVMMEAARVLLEDSKELHNSVIFLINGGEETLQDASHLFITQHPWRSTVKFVVNLEAVGTGGKEIVFQATSKQMVKAYATVPYPYGTVLANEIFATGVIVSDTDFRQFEVYGNLTGLDMAFVRNSYLYHTTKDTVENLQVGSLQNMGENILALIRYLTSPDADISTPVRDRSTVFFSLFGPAYFVVYTAQQALTIYGTQLAIAVALTASSFLSEPVAHLFALFSVIASFLGGLVFANVAAFTMRSVLDCALAWHSHELFCVFLFGPPTLLGVVTTQSLFKKRFQGKKSIVPERIVLNAQFLYFSFLAFVGQLCGISSSYLLAITSFGISVGWVTDALLKTSSTARPNILTYFTGSIFCLLIGTEGLVSFLDLFVPLGGRMGPAPADHIIASLVAALVSLSLPMFLPLTHRHARDTRRLLVFLFLVSAVSATYFSRRPAFDAMHPRRMIVLHSENITTSPSSYNLRFAKIDSAPGFDQLVNRTITDLSLDPAHVSKVSINDDIPHFDVLYPVTQFLTSYSLPLTSPANHVQAWSDKFTVQATSSKLDVIKKTRRVTLQLRQQDLMYSVVAFDAHVLSWSLPAVPEPLHRRHHIKHVANHHIDTWTIELTLQLEEAEFQAALRHSQRLKGQRANDEIEQIPNLGKIAVDYLAIPQDGIFHATPDAAIARQSILSKVAEITPPDVDTVLLEIVERTVYV